MRLSSKIDDNLPGLGQRSAVAALNQIWWGMCEALRSANNFDRAMYIFWLLGPFILLIERSPADLWLSTIAITFLGRSIFKKEFSWLNCTWVRLCFVFWGVCLVSAVNSSLPLYSLGEAFAWFRFPIFAIACVYWLGNDRRLVNAMLLSSIMGMVVICVCLALELSLVGAVDGRLSWPYGDLVPGNYLAKVSLPAFVVAVALVSSSSTRVALLYLGIIIISLVMLVATGERINLLIRVCAAALAFLVWRPRLKTFCFGALGVVLPSIALISSSPDLADRFSMGFLSHLPFHESSVYYRAMAVGFIAADQSPWLGVGPGNLRFLCDALVDGSSAYDCHPHPHNFYVQMLGETGVLGLVSGTCFLFGLVWHAIRAGLASAGDVVVATAWIVPFGLFWPIASTADFFGQWNNIFVWSAVGVALASANLVKTPADYSAVNLHGCG